jgi:hypothetical protein
VMERVKKPYVPMDKFLITVRGIPHSTHCVIHNVLTTIRMHFHPKDIIHGDLHFGNIFVDDRFVGFEQPTTPILFIDFGRTINLSTNIIKFPRDVIDRILSVDVLQLVRAACRECFMHSSLVHEIHNQAIIIIKASYYYFIIIIINYYKGRESFSSAPFNAVVWNVNTRNFCEEVCCIPELSRQTAAVTTLL